MEAPTLPNPEILFTNGILSSFIEREDTTESFEEQVIETRAHLAEIAIADQQLFEQIREMLVTIVTTWEPAAVIGLLKDYGSQYLLPVNLYEAYPDNTDPDSWLPMLRVLVQELFAD